MTFNAYNPTIEVCLERARYGFNTIYDPDTNTILAADWCDVCGNYYETSLDTAQYQRCPRCSAKKCTRYENIVCIKHYRCTHCVLVKGGWLE